jgi:radical SAM superfamily enzyme YgiQ (UPF0313 family)
MPYRRPEIIRPPSEWRSYYLPLTSGCSNNTCAFCNFHGCKLGVRDIEEVKREIDAVALFMKQGMYLPGIERVVYYIANEWDGKQLFLQDGDALVYPFPKLKEVLGYLKLKLPGIERVASYATTQDILRRSVDELKELKALKLGILYVGVETGDAGLLKKVDKGVSTDQMIEAAHKVKEAGILLSVSVILGLGGVEKSEQHAVATASVLSRMDPDFVGALTLTLVPGTPLYKEWKEGKFNPITPMQSLQELKLMIEHSSFTNCFFSSMHASNYLTVRGILPQDKTRMLKQIEAVLKSNDPALLRPEFMRGL